MKAINCLFLLAILMLISYMPAQGATEEYDVLVLRGVHFAGDTFALDARAQGILDEAAALIKANPSLRFRLEGNSTYGSDQEQNLKIGEQRARSVFNYLVYRGVKPEQLEIISYGQENIKYDENTEEGKYMNNRVDIKSLYK